MTIDKTHTTMAETSSILPDVVINADKAVMVVTDKASYQKWRALLDAAGIIAARAKLLEWVGRIERRKAHLDLDYLALPANQPISRAQAGANGGKTTQGKQIEEFNLLESEVIDMRHKYGLADPDTAITHKDIDSMAVVNPTTIRETAERRRKKKKRDEEAAEAALKDGDMSDKEKAEGLDLLAEFNEVVETRNPRSKNLIIIKDNAHLIAYISSRVNVILCGGRRFEAVPEDTIDEGIRMNLNDLINNIV